MKIYNTLTRKVEKISQRQIKAFVCGPTVYDFAHIGHARSYVSFDVIIKFLRYSKKNVYYVQNITDIDDKIINRAKEVNRKWDDVAKEFTQTYLNDMKLLGVTAVDKYAPATEYIEEIKSQVFRLLKKGVAYKISDGVYFDIKKFPDYGKLSHQDINDLEAGARVEVNKEKHNVQDFVLWKFKKEGEPSWPAQFGEGRPGWHIEDTAITEKELGKKYDLHGGGLDLIFPHHESEIAQMEAITGKKPFVKYWLHNGFVLINNEKMSKSLNNFWTIRDVLAKFSPRAIRYYCLSVHYRAPINYSDEALQHAENAVQRLDDFVARLRSANGKDSKVRSVLTKSEKGFRKAMENDFDTSSALASVFDMMNKINKLIDKNKISVNNAKEVLVFIEKINSVLGVFDLEVKQLPKGAAELIARREEARKNRDFALADKLRKELSEMGVILEDSKNGVRWKKA